MKNEIEIYAYITTDNGIRVYVSENIWYGEAEAKWRSHGLCFQSEKGNYLKIRMPIEGYFDYIAKTIPEKHQTERIKKWLETKNIGKRQKICEYCHEDLDGYVKPIEKNNHAFVRFGMDGWELSLKANGWHGSAKIRYCPMCGRSFGNG